MPNTLLVPPPPRIISCLVSARSHCCTYFFTFSNDCATFKVQRDCQSANLNEMAEQLATTCLHEITVYLLAFISVTFWSKKLVTVSGAAYSCWLTYPFASISPIVHLEDPRVLWATQLWIATDALLREIVQVVSYSYRYLLTLWTSVLSPLLKQHGPLYNATCPFPSFTLSFLHLVPLQHILVDTGTPIPDNTDAHNAIFVLGLKTDSCSQTLKPSPPTHQKLMPLHLKFNFVLPNLAAHFLKTTLLHISPLKFEFQCRIRIKNKTRRDHDQKVSRRTARSKQRAAFRFKKQGSKKEDWY